jgi:hypothetical protein
MDLSNYFATLAAKLKDIAHSDEKKRYIEVNGYDNMLGLIETDNYLTGTILVHDISMTGRLFAENSDQILDRVPGMFFVLQRCDKTSISAVKSTHLATLSICKKIIAKMRRDQYQESIHQSIAGMRNLDVTSFTYQSVGPLVSGWHGTMVQFSLVEKPGIVYSEADWID